MKHNKFNCISVLVCIAAIIFACWVTSRNARQSKEAVVKSGTDLQPVETKGTVTVDQSKTGHSDRLQTHPTGGNALETLPTRENIVPETGGEPAKVVRVK